MKKLITLTFALFLTAGMAFGQNDADVDQTGIDHEATVDQTGNNTATVLQDGGDTNVAFIMQNGDNEATILQPNQTGQHGGDAPVKSKAYQYQTGTDNDATIKQANTWSDFAQQDQYGSNLTATINQSVNGDAHAEQKQRGSDHNANIRTNNSPDAYVHQEQHGEQGDGNYADTYQVHSDGAIVDILQYGDNSATTNQRSARGASSIDIDQDGFGNSGTVIQGKGYVASGNGLTAILEQSGDDNSATIMQSNNGHTADVMQSGSLNDATVTQQ